MPVPTAEERWDRMKYLFLLYLLVISIVDIWSQKVPVLWIYGGTLGMAVFGILQLVQGKRTVTDCLCSMLPAICCYFFAIVSNAMGEGDAWIIGQIGLVCSSEFTFRILIFSFCFSACGAIVFMMINRTIKNNRIPFIPCIFLAAAFYLIG